ncbi:MAG: SH3 domain-containing protein [Spirochaetaceae bacterium]|jgi:hypothetical protein|nr:SH3 domain-containing protein [Spirochaetaceae bacterium]
MDRRRAVFRTGLLIFAAAFLAAPSLCAQETERLAFRVETGPDTTRAGLIWTVTITVDHGVPGEVTFRLPVVPPGIALERTRVLPWTGGGGRRGTRIELDFMPRLPGTAVIPPIELSAPGKRGLTDTLTVRIEGDENTPSSPPALVWGDPLPAPAQGAPFHVFLFQAAGASPGPEGNAADAFSPLPPPDAILEALPAGELPAGAILGLSIIPLKGAVLTLAPFPLTLNGGAALTPSLTLSVSRTAGLTAVEDASSGDVPRLNVEPAGTGVPPWPEGAAARLPGMTRGTARDPAMESRRFWEAGHFAEALALLRAEESASLFGPCWRPLRRSLEQGLGLENTVDETWLPRRFFLAGGVAGILAVLVLLFWGKRKRGAAYRAGVFFLFLFAAFCVFGFSASAGKRRALAQGGAARAAPAPGSSVLFTFSPGERLRVRAAAGGWMYAENAAGRAGWVPAESVIRY